MLFKYFSTLFYASLVLHSLGKMEGGDAALVPGTIYGLKGPQSGLVTLDPTTAQVTAVGPVLPQVINAGISSIDTENEIYYTLSFGTGTHLVGVSLSTGVVVYDIPIPLLPSLGKSCNVDPTTGDVFVTGNSDHLIMDMVILRVTPSENITKTIADIGPGETIVGATSTYDYVNQVLWFQYWEANTVYNIGISTSSGDILYRFNDSGYSIGSFNFDPKTELVFALGITDEETRALMTLDSTTGKLDVVATISNYTIIYEAVSGLDVAGRLLYAYFQPGQDIFSPFYLLSISLETGTVVDVVQACVSVGTQSCLWNMEVYNVLQTSDE